MANLSGIVKKISDLVTGTPADDDCFVFGKSDLKKITLAKLKDALGITSINSALTVKTYDLLSYDTSAIELINVICAKIGKIVSISGYFNSTKTIGKNINFIHVAVGLEPISRIYFPISGSALDSPNYAKMDTQGYIQVDENMPPGHYFFNFTYVAQ